MHPLDIFSDSPKFFIFEKEANKTNFGGVLTLFFSIIMTLISILYFLDYIEMDIHILKIPHFFKIFHIGIIFLNIIPTLLFIFL